MPNNITVSIVNVNDKDFISITDMAKGEREEVRTADIIKNWLRARNRLEFLGTWEGLYNPDFKVVEFDHFRQELGLPTFTLSVSDWVRKTHAIGFFSKPSKKKGTYAHSTKKSIKMMDWRYPAYLTTG